MKLEDIFDDELNSFVNGYAKIFWNREIEEILESDLSIVEKQD